MIIKSLARKRPGFKQLIAYMNREPGESFTRNLYDAARPAAVARAFERNYAHLNKRRGANALYHEVIVLPPQPHLTTGRRTAILRELAERYCELRAPGNLVYGRVHQDKAHDHIHLMISANAAASKLRTRLSRAGFAAIQVQMEREARTRFPDLQDQAIYGRATRRGPINQARSPITARQDAMERSGRKTPFKTIYRDALAAGIPNCRNKTQFEQLLAGLNLELYQRGRRIGVRNRDSGARYRLSTLGVEDILMQQQVEWARQAASQKNAVSPVRRKSSVDRPSIQVSITKPSRSAQASKAFGPANVASSQQAAKLEQPSRATPKPVIQSQNTRSGQLAHPGKSEQRAKRDPAAQVRADVSRAKQERAGVPVARPAPPRSSKKSPPTPKPQHQTSPAPRPDPRAADLLRQRQTLQERARQKLRGFDDDLDR